MNAANPLLVGQISDERDRKFRLLTPDAVAELLSVSVLTLRDWRKRRSRTTGPAFVKIGRNVVRYPVAAVRDFVRGLKVQGKCAKYPAKALGKRKRKAGG